MKKLIHSLGKTLRYSGNKTLARLADSRGELATNTIGGIIVAVVIVGLLIVAVNQFFPGFFQNMFSGMQDKLNSNW
jgi:hypothetical protein